LPIVPIESQSNITLREGRGNALITFLKERRIGDCVNAKNSRIQELQRKLYWKAKQSNCESLWKKMIGKPYSGKLNVRFDEGELEIGRLVTTPALYSTPYFQTQQIQLPKIIYNS